MMLKPCPYCGHWCSMSRSAISKTVYASACQNDECEAEGPWGDTPENAAKKHNRRAISVDDAVKVLLRNTKKEWGKLKND